MSNISNLYSKKFSANKTDTIVSFKDRLSAFLEKYPEIETRCRAYAEDWRIRNPQYEKFEDMYVDMPGLGENLMSISNAYVDDSMQRDMKFSFVTEKVVPNFDPHLVNSVRFTAFRKRIVSGTDSRLLLLSYLSLCSILICHFKRLSTV